VSDWPLPELHIACQDSTENTDFLITLELDGKNAESPKPLRWFLEQDLASGCPWSARAQTSEGYFLRFHEIADFEVDHGGRQIRCVWRHPETSDLMIRAILLDHILPPVMVLHGKYVLHAAAVRTNAGVCVFAGDSGAGKSTMAAYLAAAGNDFLSDDCLLVDERDGAVLAQPSYPSIKLMADVMQFLNLRCEGKRVAEYTSKRRISALSLGAAFPPMPLAVARLYFVTRAKRETPSIQRLPPRAAFMKLVNHSIRLDTTDRTMLKREFQITHRVVESVPAALLSLPNDLSMLPLAHSAIATDLSLM